MYKLNDNIILFSDQQIDVETLQYIQDHHIAILLDDFPLGIRIRFEHYVKKYQNISNNYSDVPKKNTISATNELPCTSVQPKAFEKKNETIELVQILSNNIQGSLIFDYFKNHNMMLNESCRNLLIEIIISDLIKKNLTMTIKLANYIADAIVTVFPSEIKVNISF